MTPPDFEPLLRELTPQVLGTVVRRFRDFAAAEDAVQEASLAAAMQWPRDGAPDNPRAWLTQVAFRRMADHIRSESARRHRESEVAEIAVVAAHSPESTAIETTPKLVAIGLALSRFNPEPWPAPSIRTMPKKIHAGCRIGTAPFDILIEAQIRIGERTNDDS